MDLKKVFAALGALGVILGAFGAHYLKNKMDDHSQSAWSTASLYLFIHVIIGLYATNSLKTKRSACFFLTGTILFSGSLYLLALTHLAALGLITPVGGLLFILGWIFLFIDI